jgi:histidinol-phosphatase (PHP family)
MILADYHMHSSNSGDSETPMEEMILSSIDKGLQEICFTEHMDMDFPLLPGLPPDPFLLDVEAYKKELTYYKDKYADKIKIKFGIEIGMQRQVARDNSDLVRFGDFDFVIASLHLLDHNDPYYGEFWSGKKVSDVLTHYFEETLENIKLFPDFDVLGHLDYIARYVPEGDHTYSYERFKDIIDEILKYLADHDKGLDLNSKALKSFSYGNSNPSPEAIARFHELGGRIITFGSDAHTPEGVASAFDQMREIALKAGFTEYYTFEKRVPTPHSL